MESQVQWICVRDAYMLTRWTFLIKGFNSLRKKRLKDGFLFGWRSSVLSDPSKTGDMVKKGRLSESTFGKGPYTFR